MMQTSLSYPELLFQLVTLITISITAGLNCSSCIDVSKVKILKNTVPGLKLDGNPNTPSSPQCKTAVNGESVSGVDVQICNDNPINSPKEYRCVHYNGQVIATTTLDLGESSGEVSVSYEGTYRNCMLVNVNTSGSCVNENGLLPEGNELRRDILGTMPISQNSVSVVVQGKKCVSNANGTFLSQREISKAPIKKSCVYIVVLFVFIYSFV